jgi:hypothetical protein
VVSRSSSPAAALAAAGLALLIGACEAGVVAPSASSTAMATASVRPSASAGSPSSPVTATPTPGPDFSSVVDLGLELDIGVLGREHTDDLLDAVSDGRSVLFSSGVLDDVASSGGAPDLWRLEPFGEPELVWKNPARDHTLARIGGEVGTYAFVDMPTTGEREWTLYLIPRHGEDPIVLDQHPGDEDVPSLVPSFHVFERRIVWTSFDRGPVGPVSQLLTAAEPTWEPVLLLEHPADEVEIWLPSQNGSDVAYTEVRYAPGRLSDERSVWLMPNADPSATRRLDTSGLATMPVVIPGAVLWKEADQGFNMFNWGRMYHYDLETAEVTEVDLGPQPYVNYPSAGQRFAAWWGNDSFAFAVYDHVVGESRLIERSRIGSDTGVLRPHLTGDLLVWERVVGSGSDVWSEIRYARLPDAADLRDR